MHLQQVSGHSGTNNGIITDYDETHENRQEQGTYPSGICSKHHNHAMAVIHFIQRSDYIIQFCFTTL
jgi:hypothetical protein